MDLKRGNPRAHKQTDRVGPKSDSGPSRSSLAIKEVPRGSCCPDRFASPLQRPGRSLCKLTSVGPAHLRWRCRSTEGFMDIPGSRRGAAR